MRFLVVLLSLALIPLSHAATLKGANGVELLAIDGQKVKVGMLQNKDINVSDGNHQIVVQFSKRINKQGMVYSRPHIFSLDVQGDTKISIRNFNSKTQAEHAIRQGLTWIVKNGKETQKIVESDVLFEEGVQINLNIEKLIVAYNQKNGNALPVASFANQQSDSLAGSPQQKAMQSKTQQLIEIYRSTSIEEKKAFRMWLLEQDIK
jgi:uncharacterized protein YccT (UPF0319 family)